MSRKTMEDRMEKIEDIRPTVELSQGMIKTICDAISQAFYSWELKEDDDNDSIGKITLDPYAEKTT